MLLNNKNNWVLSRLDNKHIKAYIHYFFCSCGHEFQIKTDLDKPIPPDILCPSCGENYFKDSDEFLHKKRTRIWKSFYWDSVVSEDENKWCIKLKYLIPSYNSITNIVELKEQNLLHVELAKDGSTSLHVATKSSFVRAYSLFLDGTVKAFSDLLKEDAIKNLLNYIMTHKTHNLLWLNKKDMINLSANEKLKCIEFFLKNPHLKEYQFFFWKMDLLHNKTTKYPLQMDMISYISNHLQIKSIKRELYLSYESFMKKCGFYNPYSDYIFSRSIDNVDLLVKLYKMDPYLKAQLFCDETFSTGVVFIEFLKKYYTKKQITEFFITHIQDIKNYKQRVQDWQDILRMVENSTMLNELENHFVKPKLKTNLLHDELIRVSHIVTHKMEGKEVFDYSSLHVEAQGKYKNLEFKLPKTIHELYKWSKKLNNCMFGYSADIHLQKSVIYGVFKDVKLLYAIEIQDAKIVQAKANSNMSVNSCDMETIREWNKSHLNAIQT